MTGDLPPVTEAINSLDRGIPRRVAEEAMGRALYLDTPPRIQTEIADVRDAMRCGVALPDVRAQLEHLRGETRRAAAPPVG